MDLISVIVPVYNVEKYLDKCIESIVNQTYKNLEIILVDDGSPDRCPEICDEWEKKDSRITVIHKKNGGLSDARNAGITIATGQYIAFVDSDDWIALELYSNLLNAIKCTESDIAACKIVKTWENQSVNLSYSKANHYELYSKTQGLKELILDREIQQVVWNKLYKRSVVEGLFFEIDKCNEDEFWTYQVYGKANQTISIDYEGYFYLQRSGSIMGSNYSMRRLDAIEAKVLRQEYLDKNFPSLSEVGKLNLTYACIYHGQLALRYLKQSEKKESVKRIKSSMKKAGITATDLSCLNFKDAMWIVMARVQFDLTCHLRNLLNIGL